MGKQIGIRWIKMAAIYLVVGVALGMHMGKSHDFLLAPVHAHINLLGWATMALMGLLHCQFSAQLGNRLAQVQFWLHQLFTPVMLVALALMLLGNTAIEPVVGISSTIVGVSVLLFLVNVLRSLRVSG
ncbi:hypothetical protein RQP54_06520 [Curvibacter sp. APW13]|uniref:hypothetical protein n=1 Tax=Curvibacter sp. APW13 TaxID=3077236 RepID=UPI0028DF5897|nr:hypothetical protein [Curvibacter sp. APW13]MDT8990518.1 hypothetical protein [Curvibacter sp. APW13]